jgi:hypothetical protein
MRTQQRILLVLGALLLAAGGLVTLAVIVLGGVLGSLVALMMATAVVAAYLGVIRPWQVRWGATDDEARRPMPGDDILGPSAGSTTRAITIQVPTERVWPWLAQLGYGKAGWYSYDWLDNDGQRSAEQIRPQCRWRARWHITPASALWIALSDPGTFIMERKMLLGIKARAEQARAEIAHHC